METRTEPQDPTLKLRQPLRRRCFSAGFLAPGAALCLVVVAAGLALFYAEENWRGKEAWAKCKKEMEAQGQNLDWSGLVPPPIPDEKNFAATPFLQLITRKPGEVAAEFERLWPKDFDNAFAQFSKMRPNKKAGEAGERQLADLAAWQAAFAFIKGADYPSPDDLDADPAGRTKAAAAVLEQLKVYEPAIEEMRQASVRPEASFDIDYEVDNPMAILLPHLGRLRTISRLLQVRAAAELAVGQTEKAYQDVRLMLRLGEALKDEPILISYLVQVAMFRATTDLIWEGLVLNKWTSAQLLDFQIRLQQTDFLAGIEARLRAERAFAIKFMEYARTQPEQAGVGNFDGTGKNIAQALMLKLLPSGWIYLEQCNYVRFFPMPANSVKTRRVEPAICQQQQKELEVQLAGQHPALRILNHRMFLGLLLPALSKVQMRAAEAQTVADEAVIACALERFRLANRQFPDQLQALSPGFLERVPNDVITGAPLVYRRTEGGQFVLYSVGWNEKDDGGVPLKPSSADATKSPHDWVWRSQPKQ